MSAYSCKHPYIQCVYEITAAVVNRFRFPPYHIDWIYALTPSGFRFRKCCRIMHKYSNNVIQKRIAERERTAAGESWEKRKYLDFLDMLLDAKACILLQNCSVCATITL